MKNGKLRFSKRILSLFLALIMLVGIVPTTVFADDVQEYDLWVGGVQVTSENKDNIDPEHGQASYNPETKTLTLAGYNYEGKGYVEETKFGTYLFTNLYGITAGFGWDECLNIELADGTENSLILNQEGENTVDSINTGKADLKIFGSGKLTASHYISTKRLTVEEATVICQKNVVSSGKEVKFKNAKVSINNLEVDSGNLTVEGGELNCSRIFVQQGDATFKNAEIFVRNNGDYRAMHVDGELTFDLSEDYVIKASTEATANPTEEFDKEKLSTYKTIKVGIPPVEYPLWVGGVKVTSENKDNIDPEHGKASYDPETKTLTLAGYNYEGKGYVEEIAGSKSLHGIITDFGFDECLNIELADGTENSLILNQESESTDNSIHTSKADLKIFGSGKLNASHNIISQQLTVENATVTSQGNIISNNKDVKFTNARLSMARLGVSGNLTVEGGELNCSIIDADSNNVIFKNALIFVRHDYRAMNVNGELNFDLADGYVILASTENTDNPTEEFDKEKLSTYKTIKIDGVYEAQIGNNYYKSFKEAVDAYKAGDTIKILKDVEVKDDLWFYKAVTIDLNGKTINGRSLLMVDESTEYEIIGSGTISAVSVSYYAKLTLNGENLHINTLISDYSKLEINKKCKIGLLNFNEGTQVTLADDLAVWSEFKGKYITLTENNSYHNFSVVDAPIKNFTIAAVGGYNRTYGEKVYVCNYFSCGTDVDENDVTLRWYANGEETELYYNAIGLNNAGSYKVYATAEYKGYLLKSEEIEITINKADPKLPDCGDLTADADGETTLEDIPLPEGYSWNNPDTVIAYGVNSYEATFIPEDTDNYNVLNNVSLEVKGLDVFAPTGEIKIGENRWRTFLNTITFGLFFKDIQKFEITAEDNESGVDKIYYFIDTTGSENPIDIDDVTWQEYESAVNTEPYADQVVYAKIVDKEGNVTYINSDGFVNDDIVPAIEIRIGAKTIPDKSVYRTKEKDLKAYVGITESNLKESGYFLSASPKNQDELEAYTDWLACDNIWHPEYDMWAMIDLGNLPTYLYVRAEDKAGNVSYSSVYILEDKAPTFERRDDVSDAYGSQISYQVLDVISVDEADKNSQKGFGSFKVDLHGENGKITIGVKEYDIRNNGGADMSNMGTVTVDGVAFTVTGFTQNGTDGDWTVSYKYELTSPFYHDKPANDDVFLTSISVYAEDETKDKETAFIVIEIIDDEPTVEVSISSNESKNGSSVNGTMDINYGADGKNAFLINGVSGSLNDDETITFQFDNGNKVIVSKDGKEFTFVPAPGFDGNEKLVFTATDSDGDKASDEVTVSVRKFPEFTEYSGEYKDEHKDDPTAAGTKVNVIIVDEGATNNGSKKHTIHGIGGQGEFKFNLYGEDGVITIAGKDYAITNNGGADMSNMGTVTVNGVAFTVTGITQNDTNSDWTVSYKYELRDPQNHDKNNGEDEAVVGNIPITVIDSSDDSADGHIIVEVHDDEGYFHRSTSLLNTDDLSIVVFGFVSIRYGFDGPASENAFLVNGQVGVKKDDGSYEYKLSKGTLTFNKNLNFYDFKFDEEGEQKITFTVTDGDGDVDEKTVTHTCKIPRYNVTLPENQKGYTLTADKTVVKKGESVSFNFEKQVGYSNDGLVITVNGKPVTPDTDGNFTVENVENDLEIAVSGIVNAPSYVVTIPETVTANDSFKVSADNVTLSEDLALNVYVDGWFAIVNSVFGYNYTDTLNFKLYKDSEMQNEIKPNDVVLTLNGGKENDSHEETVYLFLLDKPKHSGEYEGALTFTVKTESR